MGPNPNGPLSTRKLRVRAIRYSGFFGVGPFIGSDRWRFLGFRECMFCCNLVDVFGCSVMTGSDVFGLS